MNNDVIKQAYFNPAPWSDDVLNAYTQIKLVYEQKKRKARAQALAQSKVPLATEKKANFEQLYENGFKNLVTSMVSGAQSISKNPTVLLPSAKTLLLTSAATLAAAKAPVWAGGPQKGEKALDGKRILRNVALYNAIGGEILNVPSTLSKVNTAVSSGNTRKAVVGIASLGPVAGLAYEGIKSTIKDGKPSGKKALIGFAEGTVPAFAAGFADYVTTLAKAGL